MKMDKMKMADDNAMSILKKKMNEMMAGKMGKKGGSVSVEVEKTEAPESEEEMPSMDDMAAGSENMDKAKAACAMLSDEEKKTLAAELMA